MILLCYDTDALVAGMCFIQIKSFKVSKFQSAFVWHVRRRGVGVGGVCQGDCLVN